MAEQSQQMREVMAEQSQNMTEQMREVLALVGEKCLKVLELWRMSYSMREIAVAMGYKGEHVARKKKSQCFRSLLDILDAHPALLKMLEEMKWGE